MVAIFMISAKLTTLGILKIKLFWNEGYDAIISVPGVNNKILSHESNYINDSLMWQELGNSSIYMTEVVMASILQGFDQKNQFFRATPGLSSIIWN